TGVRCKEVRQVAVLGTSRIEEAMTALDEVNVTLGLFDDTNVGAIADIMEVRAVPARREPAFADHDPYDHAILTRTHGERSDFLAHAANDWRRNRLTGPRRRIERLGWGKERQHRRSRAAGLGACADRKYQQHAWQSHRDFSPVHCHPIGKGRSAAMVPLRSGKG